MTPLPPAFPLREAALLGCAAPTGLGAVFNTAAAEPGKSFVVFGVGGIGLCAIAAARIAGLGPIVAVDPSPDRLRAAEQMGATQTLNPGELTGRRRRRSAQATRRRRIRLRDRGKRRAASDDTSARRRPSAAAARRSSSATPRTAASWSSTRSNSTSANGYSARGAATTSPTATSRGTARWSAMAG